MKILCISTSKTGSATLATLHIHQAHQDYGVESCVLTFDGESYDNTVFVFKPPIKLRDTSDLLILIKDRSRRNAQMTILKKHS